SREISNQVVIRFVREVEYTTLCAILRPVGAPEPSACHQRGGTANDPLDDNPFDGRMDFRRVIAVNVAIAKKETRNATAMAPTQNSYAPNVVISEQHNCLYVGALEPANNPPPL